MRERYIPALVMLIAGGITSILNIINKNDMLTSLKRLLFSLVVFYIIGGIAKLIIVETIIKKINSDNIEDVEEEIIEEGIIEEEPGEKISEDSL